MKRLFVFILILAMSFSMVACSQDTQIQDENEIESSTQSEGDEGGSASESGESPQMIDVDIIHPFGGEIKIEVPLNPDRIVVLNYQTLDFLDKFGLGDRVVGMIKSEPVPSHLQKYFDDENIVNLGEILDPLNIDLISSLNPNIIFSNSVEGTELLYDSLNEIAPTIPISLDYEKSVMESFEEFALLHAEIFDLTDEVASTIEEYNERVAGISAVSAGQSAELILYRNGTPNELAERGFFDIVVNEMGFAVNEEWFELTDWIFVFDGDRASGNVSVPAEEHLTERYASYDAYQNGRLIYIESFQDFAYCIGGFTSVEMLIEEFEGILGII